MSSVMELGKRARKAALKLGSVSTEAKDRALEAMAQALIDRAGDLLKANQKDLKVGEEKKIGSALIDRLMLNEARIEEMAQGLREVAQLPDPIGQVVAGWKRPNGLFVTKVRVPLGVIGMIYEARPNVTVDAAGLCLKSGNAVIMRGGSVAQNSNLALSKVIAEAATGEGIPDGAIQSIETTDREAVYELMRMNEYVDVLIPRGGASLIQSVIDKATVPVIETGVGNCHVYVDRAADIQMAVDIVVNAKCQRPGVCNAAETLLVHKDIAGRFLPAAAKELVARKVVLRGDKEAQAIVKDMEAANEEDWKTEYLELKLAVKVVDDLADAINHINTYGTKHSEAIITEDYSAAQRFLGEVDAAAVYVNASTRFTDGGQFGLGAEIGISTQKLHVRGPMGLEALTSTKYVVYGTGQVRS